MMRIMKRGREKWTFNPSVSCYQSTQKSKSKILKIREQICTFPPHLLLPLPAPYPNLDHLVNLIMCMSIAWVFATSPGKPSGDRFSRQNCIGLFSRRLSSPVTFPLGLGIAWHLPFAFSPSSLAFSLSNSSQPKFQLPIMTGRSPTKPSWQESSFTAFDLTNHLFHFQTHFNFKSSKNETEPSHDCQFRS
jgi:hypothetical protein